MSWGYKIIIVYAVFVAGIMFMVFKSTSQKLDLVTDDYYGKELKFQQQIDQTGRAAALSENIKTEMKDGQLSVHFPKEFDGKTISGQLQLYFAADKDRDVTESFSVTTSTAVMAIPAKNKGPHELQVNCSVDGVTYYFTQKIVL
jgi:hypothetical protein